uniref:Uncharacterized protein n=1 Tax=Arundo donax TaxID=35708 RepID=A0A0A8Z724_ARUDO
MTFYWYCESVISGVLFWSVWGSNVL